ncbi:DUF3747 domain-containing protein [Lyngbya aestuarii]|uniref:DUF3747 domain-containing protein n=1 Tax=Lyngbya aestuarii TaxID=118322 RepID=UPI00403D7B0F
MNISQWLQVVVLTTASFFSFGALNPTIAGTFDQTEVNTDDFVAVAVPFGDNQHQLLIIEQVSRQQPCWSERGDGDNLVTVEPLLLNFDFTGICRRSTDSNGYSIRMDGEDLGLDYILRIVERDGELVLVGTPVRIPNAPEVEIGRTRGISDSIDKIFLDPGWRLTKRTYQGKMLGHIYLTSDVTSPLNALDNTNTEPLVPSSGTEPLAVPPQRELIFSNPQSEPDAVEEEFPLTDPQNTPSAVPERVIPVLEN